MYFGLFIYTLWSQQVCNRQSFARLFSLLGICYAISNVIRLLSAVSVCALRFCAVSSLSKAFNDNRQISDRNVKFTKLDVFTLRHITDETYSNNFLNYFVVGILNRHIQIKSFK